MSLSNESPERIPYRERLTVTLARTSAIALFVGTGWLTIEAVGDWTSWTWREWLVRLISVFWISFGGHWVEICYLNYLRMRLPHSHVVEVAARICTWYAGGSVLYFGILFTGRLLQTDVLHELLWWQAGFLFIGIELLVHSIWHRFGRGSFYDGRG